MTITEADVISAVKAYTFLSIQTAAEASASTNLDADLLYNDGSFNQGNFSIFCDDAIAQLASDVILYNIVLTDAQTTKAYAYLIQHYYEMKFKDWDANELSINNDIVKKVSSEITSGLASYKNLINTIIKSSLGTIDTTVVRHADDDNYPTEFKDVPFDDLEMDVV